MKPRLVFTERERTPALRQELIDKVRAWSVAQGAVPSARAEALYTRYVAGQLTLQGVTDELRAQDAQRQLFSALADASVVLVQKAQQAASTAIMQVSAMQPENQQLA